MKNNGLKSCAERHALTRGRGGWRIVAYLSLSAMLLIGACATDGESDVAAQRTLAQRDLDASSEALGRPLVSEETVQEGTLLGGLLGAGVSFGFGSRDDNVGLAVPVGLFAGNMAGRYVAAKQAEYSEEVAVIEGITRDAEKKNKEAGSTIKAMEVVIAEHRVRLAEIRTVSAKGRKNESRLKQELAAAKNDLEMMKQTVVTTEGHLALFSEARGIVVRESESVDLDKNPAMKTMDGEIETLRGRIRSMHKLVGELSSVS